MRTPVLAILFAVGAKFWVGKGPWVLARRLKEDSDSLLSVRFSPDATRIVVASRGRTASVWDVRTGKRVCVLSHSHPVRDAAWSPDGTHIVTASTDQTVRVWNVPSGVCVLALRCPFSNPESSRFSHDGKKIVAFTCGGRIFVWSADKGALQGDFPRDLDLPTREVHSTACYRFSGDGGRVVTRSIPAAKERIVRVWNACTGECVASLRFLPEKNAPNWAPVVVDCSKDSGLVMTGVSGTAHIWEIPSGRLIRSLKAQEGEVRRGVFSPDGKYVLIVDKSRTARLWSIGTGDCVFVMQDGVRLLGGGPQGYYPELPQAVFSPDGKTLALVNKWCKLRMIDVGSNQKLLDFGDRCITSGAFSQDGRVIAALSEQGEVRIWRRRRPDGPWGYLCLPEVWLTAAVAAAFVWSLSRDLRA